ncbi:prolipoprotein diacylglyceryl transferase [bacterium]|nr:prolipoprotein diacylglyceryl transferase [bacterium]
MHPVLIDFGRFKLYSYGLMLFLAFALGIYIAYRRSKRFGIEGNVVLDVSSAMIISGLLGGRLLYVLTHLEEFRGRWLDIINPVQSDGTIGIAGLVLLGGVVLAVVTLVFLTWLKDIPLLRLMDVLAPSLALGIALGRLGCYLNGCCFGLVTDISWAVSFPEGCSAHSIMGDQHIHPTQLYAFIYNGLLFIFLLWEEKLPRAFDGRTIFLMFTGYGIFRFFNETLRWHEQSLHAINWDGGFLTISQLVSISLLLVGLAGLLLLPKTKYYHIRSLT